MIEGRKALLRKLATWKLVVVVVLLLLCLYTIESDAAVDRAQLHNGALIYDRHKFDGPNTQSSPFTAADKVPRSGWRARDPVLANCSRSRPAAPAQKHYINSCRTRLDSTRLHQRLTFYKHKPISKGVAARGEKTLINRPTDYG